MFCSLFLLNLYLFLIGVIVFWGFGFLVLCFRFFLNLEFVLLLLIELEGANDGVFFFSELFVGNRMRDVKVGVE